MGYSIEGQSPSEVENIRQRTTLQQRMEIVNHDIASPKVNPHVREIKRVLEDNLESQADLDDIYTMLKNNLDSQVNLDTIYEIVMHYGVDLNERFNVLEGDLLSEMNTVLKDNLVDQTDIDEIYKYMKNTRSNVNKKLNAVKKQIDEQNEKLEKIISLLENEA